MSKWTYKESLQKQQNEDIDRLGIFTKPQRPLYHYTSREVFWKIMDSETFLARHIMFSNDFEENKIGNEKIALAAKENGIQIGDIEDLPFMICFCEKEDLLSQWRGYAKEGIAMEFDFSKGLYGFNDNGFSTYSCYTIMNNETVNEEYLSKIPWLDKGANGDQNFFVGAIASPYSVIYTESFKQQEEKSDHIIDQKIQKIRSLYNRQDDPEDAPWKLATAMIPFVKNKKFNEESEYRLIFDMDILISESKQHILQQKYTYLDVDGVRKPNIRVKFGNMLEHQNEITKLYYVNSDLDDNIKELTKELRKERINLEIVKKPRKYKMNQDEIFLSDSIHQEEIYTKLRTSLHRRGNSSKKISIWCDGHPPIRKIIVGPSKDAELMKCSIEEYLKTKYWTKDIKVEISKIPLRS